MLTKENIKYIYGLSPLQEGLFFLDREGDSSVRYFQQKQFSLEGEILPNRLAQAWDRLVERHDILRTVFVHKTTDRPIQVVLNQRPVEINYQDVSGHKEPGKAVNNYRRADLHTPFRLDTDKLIRVALFKVGHEKFEMVFSFHHIILDAWSVGVIFSEWLSLYDAIVRGQSISLPATTPYRQYIQWLGNVDIDKGLAEWAGYLKGFDSVTSLRLQAGSQDKGGYELAKYSLTLNDALLQKATAISAGAGITLYQMFQTVWGVLLAKLNNSRDAVMGTVVSGRPAGLQGVEQMVGLFINTIPARVTYTATDSFNDILKVTRATAGTLQSLHYHQLADIQAASEVRDGLFDHILLYQNLDVSSAKEEADSYTIKEREDFEQTNYDLNLVFAPGEQFRILFEYNGLVFEKDYIRHLADYFQNLLADLLEQASLPVDQVVLRSGLSPHETVGEAKPRPEGLTIHGLFERQAATFPDQTATVFQGRHLTYRELNDRAEEIARYLLASGKLQADGGLVGVKLRKSDTLIAVLFGIMKAGAAYLPLDPSYPAQRLKHLVEDSKVQVLIRQENSAERDDFTFNGLTITLDAWGSICYPEGSASAYTNISLPQVSEEAAAYLIYTSGSTGTPNGVEVAHRSIVNTLLWRQEYYNFGPGDNNLQFPSISFDSSIEDIFSVLIAGGSLVIPEEENKLEPEYLAELIRSHAITHCLLVPSFYSALLRALPDEASVSLKAVTVAGEAVPAHLVEAHYRKYPTVALHNEYGPTECAVCASATLLSPEEAVTIGRPITNVNISIRDKRLSKNPPYVPGELCIGGAGVTAGYINRPELTANKFVSDPEGQRLYRTGDLARLLPDGRIDFIGRADEQVKVRGFRINPSEIENVLLDHVFVKEALVIAGTRQDGQYLSAFVVPANPVKAETLKNYLRQQLPYYMVPEKLTLVETFPVLPNNKVDRQTLLSMETTISDRKKVAPQTDTEIALSAIFKEILGLPAIYRHDHFFELGGHSIHAITLTTRVFKQFKIRLSIQDIFSNPTLNSLAAKLDSQAEGYYEAIPAAGPGPYYPLSHAQKRLWAIEQGIEARTNYNLFAGYRLKGMLQEKHALTAITKLLIRHESLRTVFHMVEGEPMQYILPSEECERYITRIVLEEGYTDEDVARIASQACHSPMDLKNGPLFRAYLLSAGAQEHYLFFALHHIIADGWSVSVLRSEFTQLYNALARNEPVSLRSLDVQYKDYAVWEHSNLGAGESASQKAFWQQFLAGKPLRTDLATDLKEANEDPAYQGGKAIARFSRKQYHGLRQLAEFHEATLFMTLLAIVKVLLHKHTRQEAITVVTPVTGREHEDLAPLVGFFVNTLPIATDIQAEEPFSDLLERVRQRTLEALQHQAYPFDLILEDLVQRDLDGAFNVMVLLESQVADTGGMHGVEVDAYDAGFNKSNFDITFGFEEGDDSLSLVIDYRTGVYAREKVERIISNLLHLTDHLLENMHQPISRLDVLSADEKHLLLHELNDTAMDYPSYKGMYALVRDAADRKPAREAIIHDGIRYTYARLMQDTDTLAGDLQASLGGNAAGSVIGVHLEPSYQLVVTLLATWKVQAVYLPLGMNLPEDRVQHLLSDSRASLLIKQNAGGSLSLNTLDRAPRFNLSGIALADHPAYIIYTSGSTGKPKGVLIRQESIADRVLDHNHYLQIPADVVGLQFASINFDASLIEIGMPLVAGGSLVISGSENKNSLPLLAELLLKERVSLAIFPPLYLKELRRYALPHLRKIISTGEAALLEDAAFYAENHDFYNGYGPTETCIGASFYQVTLKELAANRKQGSVPIGRPFGNTTIYILDENLQLLPYGAVGEICVGGIGLAIGYLNDADLSAEKFVANPWHYTDGNSRLYRTGDLGRWNAYGQVEYLGRVDEQIQIRGIRVEPGEIRACLMEQSGLTDAVVIVKEVQGEPALVAYYTTDAEVPTIRLRHDLKSNLPAHMVPDYFVKLDALPINANGKTDRSALPVPEPEQTIESVLTPPATETEQVLLTLWQDVLNRTDISTDQDFFEIGGHSLKAIRLISRIYAAFGVSPELKDLYEYPTIRQLAVYLGKNESGQYQPIETIPYSDTGYALSPGQERIWLLSQMEEANTAYNITVHFALKGQLSREALHKALFALLSRHEILRTNVRVIDEEPRQVIRPAQMSSIPLCVDQVQAADLPSYLEKVDSHPFDLEHDPLFKVYLAEMAPDYHILSISIHHIIADGWSMKLMIDELMEYYRQAVETGKVAWEPLPIQYKDYAAYQLREMETEAYELHRQYWLEKLEHPLPRLDLPIKGTRPPLQTYIGGEHRYTFDAELSQALMDYQQAHRSGMFILLTTLVNTLLFRYTGDSDIIIGTSMIDRPHTVLEEQIGFYLNTLVLRNEIPEGISFRQLLQRVKANVFEARTHESYPFDRLVGELNLPRDLSHSPVFDVYLEYQDIRETGRDSIHYDLPDLTISQYDTGHIASKFDLSFSFGQAGDRLELQLVYNRDLFEGWQIEAMAHHLDRLAKSVMHSDDQLLHSYSLLSGEETVLLDSFTRTELALPRVSSALEVIEKIATQYADKAAIQCNDLSLSYSELLTAANRMANFLLSKGLQNEEPVIYAGERGINTLVAMLGIMKAGGVYVPVSPEYPADRLIEIISESKARMIIGNAGLIEEGKLQEIIQSTSPDLFLLTDAQEDDVIAHRDGVYLARQEDVDRMSGIAPDHVPQRNDLAYVIYTSGSTGKPKGAMVEHLGMLNHLYAKVEDLHLDKDTLLVQNASQTFDISIWQFLAALMTGGTTLVYDQEMVMMPGRLSDSIAEEGVTVLEVVPSYLTAMLDEMEESGFREFPALQYLLVTGETLKSSLAKRWFNAYPSIKMVNAYGPTEASDDITHHIMKEAPDGLVPIGKPLWNCHIYVLDDYLNRCAPGVKGELYVSGICVGRGYLNDELRTAKAFLEDPFRDITTRMYRTGDIARYLPDGTIEFYGRKDGQVKVRGHRIELGEIEQKMTGLAAVSEAVVLLKQDLNGQNFLSGFATLQKSGEEGTYEENQLREALRLVLPAYMVPDFLTILTEMPLTRNGKVDRLALRGYKEAQTANTEHQAPQNERQQLIWDIWQDVLDTDHFGITNDFFQVGGHSLRAMKVIGLLNKTFNIHFPLKDFFADPTIAGIQKNIDILTWSTSAAEKEDDQTLTEIII